MPRAGGQSRVLDAQGSIVGVGLVNAGEVASEVAVVILALGENSVRRTRSR